MYCANNSVASQTTIIFSAAKARQRLHPLCTVSPLINAK